MRIKITSIMVDDQEKALKFYTDVLGFRKKNEIPMGPYKWLTVVSAEGPNDLELSIEPNVHPAAKAFQEAMFAQRIPLVAFEVTGLEKEYERLKSRGVEFTSEPQKIENVKLAAFSDTCGNVIQLYEQTS